jgi:hypothetical protein
MDLKPLKLDFNPYPKMTPTLNHVTLGTRRLTHVDLAWEVIINNIQTINVWLTSWRKHLKHPPLDQQISWSLIFIVIIVFIIEIIESTLKKHHNFASRQITFFYDHLKSSNHYWKNYGSN